MNDNDAPGDANARAFTFADFLAGLAAAGLVYVLLTAAIVLTGPR